MNKHEITSKIKEITETGAVCGVDVYVCLKGEEQEFYIEKMISMNSVKENCSGKHAGKKKSVRKT